MRIVDRYKLPYDSLYAKKKAILDLIHGQDFDDIPNYLRPSNDEINNVFSTMDFRIFNDMDYAIIMFAKELGMKNDSFWYEIPVNWIYPKLSTLSFKLHVMNAINMEFCITNDIANVLDNINYQYIKYTIVESDDQNCIIYLNGDYDDSLMLEGNIKLSDALDKMKVVLLNEYINIYVSNDVYTDEGFTLYSFIEIDFDENGFQNQNDDSYFFPVIIRPKDHDYEYEILINLRKKYPYIISKERSIYYDIFTPDGGLANFDGYINTIIPFTGYIENYSLLTLSEFIKRDYLFEIHDIYEFMLIGNVLYIPKISENTIIASDCLKKCVKYRHLRVVINSMKYLLADNVSRDLYIKRIDISNKLIDKIFEIAVCENRIAKSYFEISKVAKDPWQAYIRDIKNQFHYNPALFTITIMGFIIACSSIIQVLQTANIIKPIS